MVGPYARCTFALAALLLGAAAACHESQPLAPTPVILPDAITVPVGQSQVFTVLYAPAAVEFDVWSDAGDWHQYVQFDVLPPDRVAVRALRPTTDGYVYIRAQIGSGRSPLVAVMAISNGSAP